MSDGHWTKEQQEHYYKIQLKSWTESAKQSREVIDRIMAKKKKSDTDLYNLHSHLKSYLGAKDLISHYEKDLKILKGKVK